MTPQESVGIFGGRGDEFDDCFEDVLNAEAHFGGGGNAVFAGDGEDVLELLAAAVHVGGGQVDLVEDGDDGEVLFHRQVDVGHGLGFHALGGINDQDGPFAGRERTRDFVGKIDVARGVEEVEAVGFPVFGRISQGDGVGFDGDALFALQVHGIEVLGLGLALGDGLTGLHEAVGQGRLAMIDVGDDGEIAGEFDGHGGGR